LAVEVEEITKTPRCQDSKEKSKNKRLTVAKLPASQPYYVAFGDPV